MGHSTPRSTSPRIALFAAVSFAVVAIDQLTKWWALESLADRAPIRVVSDLLSLRLVFNPGAAFGTGAGFTIVLSVVAITVSAVLIALARRLHDRVWTIGLGLFLGGALGNLMDRLVRDPGFLRGHVIDFIDYAGFFVGNVADIALTVAAIMVVIRSWQGVHFDGTRDGDGHT